MRVLLLITLTLASCGAGATSPSPRASSPAAATPSPTPTLRAATASPAPSPTVRAADAVRYVAIGASDSVGVGARDPQIGSWPARVAARLPAGSVYRNVAVSGSLTEQARMEQLPSAVRERPTVATIWLAVNDLNADVSAAQYGRSIGAIVDALAQETQARIFVGTVPDLRAVPAYASVDPTALLARIQAYNAVIAAAAAKQPGRAFVVDLFTGSAELTTQITVSPDGFHPSDAGYVLIAQRFADAMRKGGIPLAP